MFFWYFPARIPSASPAPLILWLQGGPGSSGIEHGLLTINGPIRLDAASNLYERPLGEGSWNDEFNVVWVDNPIGTGFSFVDGDEARLEAYATNQDQVSDCLVDLLNHLYDSGLGDRSQALFVAGESYGGKCLYFQGHLCARSYPSTNASHTLLCERFFTAPPPGHYSPALGAKILSLNSLSSPSSFLPLGGVLIGDGLTAPGLQELTKPSAAFYLGLIDGRTLALALSHSAAAAALVLEGDYVGAKAEREEMEGLVADASGVNLYDVRRFDQYDSARQVAWLNEPEVKDMLGVGEGRAFGTNDNVGMAMSGDVMKSYKSDVATILEGGLPVLLYQGQFDWKDGSSSNEAWVATLGIESYLNDTRRILFREDVDGGEPIPYGWIKGRENSLLRDAVILNAGHMVPMDQPLSAYNMMTRFVRGEKL